MIKNKNKFVIFKTILAIALIVISFLLAFAPAPARAQGYNGLSFATTNIIASATSYVSYPTNVVGTNGIALGTGTAVDVRNYDRVGIVVYGQNTVTNGGNLVIALVRSASPNPPVVSTNTTNLFGLGHLDWETPSFTSAQFTNTSSYTLTIPIPPNTTNGFCWMTNLDQYCIGPANWLGIYSISNTASTGSITNFTVLLNKKIIPTRWP